MAIDSYTKLLIHGLTDTVDYSASGHTVTLENLAHHSYGRSKFGAGCGAIWIPNPVTGTNSRITVADSADWNFGSGDFTIEMWLYPLSTAKMAFFAYGADVRIGIAMNWSSGHTGYGISSTGGSFNVWSPDSGPYGTITWQANTWQHFAFVRDTTAGTYTGYIDGVQDQQIESSADPYYGTEGLQFGRWGRAADPMWYNGWIQDIRISKGIARYTSNFTPPSLPFNMGKISGTCLDGSSNPIPHAAVPVFTSGGSLLQTAVTDANGDYSTTYISDQTVYVGKAPA